MKISRFQDFYIFFQKGLTQNVSYIYRKRFGSTLFEIENYQITHDQISKGLTQNVSYIYRKRFGSTLFGINLAKNVEFLVHFYFTSSTFASLAQIFFKKMFFLIANDIFKKKLKINEFWAPKNNIFP